MLYTCMKVGRGRGPMLLMEEGGVEGRERQVGQVQQYLLTRIAALFMVHLLDGQAPACLNKT